ncbi:MAG: hypothetical protein U0998_03795 [Moraxellaceae bacterium]|nr:hypothetical protein [Moraxellaceae bacterium]
MRKSKFTESQIMAALKQFEADAPTLALRCAAQHQADEINEIWPETNYHP